jgi:hypothetical protein
MVNFLGSSFFATVRFQTKPPSLQVSFANSSTIASRASIFALTCHEMGHQTWLAERREKILGVCGDKFVRQESEMAMQKEKENLGLVAAKK